MPLGPYDIGIDTILCFPHMCRKRRRNLKQHFWKLGEGGRRMAGDFGKERRGGQMRSFGKEKGRLGVGLHSSSKRSILFSLFSLGVLSFFVYSAAALVTGESGREREEPGSLPLPLFLSPTPPSSLSPSLGPIRLLANGLQLIRWHIDKREKLTFLYEASDKVLSN